MAATDLFFTGSSTIAKFVRHASAGFVQGGKYDARSHVRRRGCHARPRLGHRAAAECERTHAKEIKCGEAIGDDAEQFLDTKLRAITDCNGSIASHGTCNTGRRDQRIANATARLARQIASDCGNVMLENLGFPGTCPDGTGGSFTRTTSRRVSPRNSKPPSTRRPRSRSRTSPKGRNRNASGRSGASPGIFVRKFGARRALLLRPAARRHSIEHQLPRRSAPGTGDAGTDKLISKAMGLITSGRTIHRDCRKSDLATLGFPDRVLIRPAGASPSPICRRACFRKWRSPSTSS